MFSMNRPSRNHSDRANARGTLAGAAANLTHFCGYAGWGGLTAVALNILVITSRTESANERLRWIFGTNDSSTIARMPPRVAQLESETQLLAAQVRALT
jgi:hypothetical protein